VNRHLKHAANLAILWGLPLADHELHAFQQGSRSQPVPGMVWLLPGAAGGRRRLSGTSAPARRRASGSSSIKLARAGGFGVLPWSWLAVSSAPHRSSGAHAAWGLHIANKLKMTKPGRNPHHAAEVVGPPGCRISRASQGQGGSRRGSVCHRLVWSLAQEPHQSRQCFPVAVDSPRANGRPRPGEC